MTYSIIGLLAVIIHLIINNDVFRGTPTRRFPAARGYRNFLLAVILYHTTDAFWGVLHEQKLVLALYWDTMLYFAAMGFSVLLWTMFVVRHLQQEGSFDKVLRYAGWLFFAFQVFALVANLFSPLLFSVDESCVYEAGPLRYVTLIIQILMFLMASAYTLWMAAASSDAVRRRYMTCGLFGLAMIVAITAQVFYPLWPMYSIGYLLGGCVLHTFVVEDERLEHLRKLEEALSREERQEQELYKTRGLAYTDPLTGVKSKHAYQEAETRMNDRIAKGEVTQFAVAVFDLNGLKEVNDSQGHDAGDLFIKAGCRIVCDVFKHSPVFRVGGDEFVAILQGEDYEHRSLHVEEFERQMDSNMASGDVVLAMGMACFDPGRDTAVASVFKRADELMYANKRQLKARSR